MTRIGYPQWAIWLLLVWGEYGYGDHVRDVSAYGKRLRVIPWRVHG